MPMPTPSPGPAGGGSPQGGPGAPGSQPPFGVTSATGPTANRGLEAAGMQKLVLVVKQLEELVPMFGAASDPGKAVIDALQKLVKLVPAGSVSPAAEKSNIEQMAMRNTQANQQMQALKQRQMSEMAQGAA